PKLVALSGGFKVSFGIAHFLADAALQTVCGHTPVIPSGFRLQEHVSIASQTLESSDQFGPRR
ncbi:D-amino-acid oxidase, partial [Rhizobium sp. BR5]